MLESLRLYLIVFNQTKLTLVPSMFLAVVLSLPYLSAALLILAHDAPNYLQALLCLLVFVSGYIHICRNALLNTHHAVTDIIISEDKIKVRIANNQGFEALIIGRSLISRYACLLTLGHEPVNHSKPPLLNRLSSRSHLLITPYNVACLDSFRRFRVFVLFGKHSDCSAETA